MDSNCDELFELWWRNIEKRGFTYNKNKKTEKDLFKQMVIGYQYLFDKLVKSKQNQQLLIDATKKNKNHKYEVFIQQFNEEFASFYFNEKD